MREVLDHSTRLSLRHNRDAAAGRGRVIFISNQLKIPRTVGVKRVAHSRGDVVHAQRSNGRRHGGEREIGRNRGPRIDTFGHARILARKRHIIRKSRASRFLSLHDESVSDLIRRGRRNGRPLSGRRGITRVPADVTGNGRTSRRCDRGAVKSPACHQSAVDSGRVLRYNCIPHQLDVETDLFADEDVGGRVEES